MSYRIHRSTDSADKIIWIVFKNEERYAMFRSEEQAKEYIEIKEQGLSYSGYGLKQAEECIRGKIV